MKGENTSAVVKTILIRIKLFIFVFCSLHLGQKGEKGEQES